MGISEESDLGGKELQNSMSSFVKDKSVVDSPSSRPGDNNRLTGDDGDVGGHEYGDDHPYMGLLEDANKETFDDLKCSQCIVTGMTTQDVPVLVFIPRLGFEKLNCVSQEDKDRALKRMLLFFIKSADEIVQRSYILLFAYTPLSILSQIPLVYKYYKMLPRSYKKNVRKLIVLHPAYLIRSFFEVGVRWFVKSKFYRKLFFFDSVAEVQEILDPFHVCLPAGLLRYDEADRGSGGGDRFPKDDGSTSSCMTRSAPLETLYDPELGTTKFIHRCRRYLSGEGRLDVQGLFRITGDGEATEVVKARAGATQAHSDALESVVFPTDEGQQGRALTGGGGGEAPGGRAEDKASTAKFGVLMITDVHTAASAMKASLRYLPVPVVTYEARDALASVTSKLSRSASAGDLRAWDGEMDRVLQSMPAAHRNTLESVLSLLADVARREEANSMTPANLGKIFAPSLMRSRDSGSGSEEISMAFAEIAFGSKVLTRLITTKMTT